MGWHSLVINLRDYCEQENRRTLNKKQSQLFANKEFLNYAHLDKFRFCTVAFLRTWLREDTGALNRFCLALSGQLTFKDRQ
jgi:hypothetical protein